MGHKQMDGGVFTFVCNDCAIWIMKEAQRGTILDSGTIEPSDKAYGKYTCQHGSVDTKIIATEFLLVKVV